MKTNRLIIAAAGSGKTTYLVNEALKAPPSKNVLITTYTEANEAGIRDIIIKIRGYIPANITVQTWFSFLLQHGVRPYQGLMNDILWEKDIKGMLPTEGKSGIKYSFINEAGKKIDVEYREEDDFLNHYFTDSLKIYSDKISKFVLKCNEKAEGAVISRLSQIYSYIYIDEIQDLAGYDLDFIKLLFKSLSSILLVGDPRQVTYLTHHSRRYQKYSDGKIKEFVENEMDRKMECIIDEETLNHSHRNNQIICDFSGKLYPDLPTPTPCVCHSCRGYTVDHEGIYLVKTSDVDNYLQKYRPVQLRWSIDKNVNNHYNAINFGASKGLTFDRVLIYPTEKMMKWIKNNIYPLNNESRAKLYVGITRARYSVSFVMDFDDTSEYIGTEKFSMKDEQ